jgi:hypothetical protein
VPKVLPKRRVIPSLDNAIDNKLVYNFQRLAMSSVIFHIAEGT